MLLLGALWYLKPDAPKRRLRPRPGPPRTERIEPMPTAATMFSGTTPGQTDGFSVTGPWRLHWKIDGLPSAGSAGLTIISRDTGKPVFEKQGLSAPDEGSVVIKRGGDFYVLVSSYEVTWTLTVEPSPSSSP